VSGASLVGAEHPSLEQRNGQVDTRQQFFAFRLSQFTEHQPGCSVAAQTENPLQPKALMPFFWLVMFHMARNQVLIGR
jgi:hypothetical protein